MLRTAQNKKEKWKNGEKITDDILLTSCFFKMYIFSRFMKIKEIIFFSNAHSHTLSFSDTQRFLK